MKRWTFPIHEEDSLQVTVLLVAVPHQRAALQKADVGLGFM
jgi:hypothetical protein